MTQYTMQDTTIALCGIYQAASLVNQLATTGKCNTLSFEASINSLFNDNPKSTMAVYSSKENLQLGVQSLLSQMQSSYAKQIKSIEITTYVLSLIILERKLNAIDGAFKQISNVINTAKNQREYFDKFHENVINSLARAYTENISSLSPRIMVKGRDGHLKNSDTANQIRAVLLAGIRAAVLWRQVGGSRLKLIFLRNKYITEAQKLYIPDFKIDN